MTEIIKKRASRRLKIAEGQIRGLERMVREEKYCVDIINQSLAIKEALSSFEDFILENHLATHVVEQMKSGQQSKAIKEILSVYKVSKRK
ncbi:MAG: metal-sensing transcriptional repressor [Candidatus Ryanbacteria bacterium]|nr:metal-sensing transcriptional repressor [Candidatus Ryanbacteria bacterium]